MSAYSCPVTHNNILNSTFNNSDFSYNSLPSTNINGNLTVNGSEVVSGTVSASGFLGTATNASGVSLTSDNTLGDYPVIFSKTTASTNNSLCIDQTTSPLMYNPSNNTLACSYFLGILSGSASKVLIYAEETTTGSQDPAGIFLKRNIAFERLRLLARVFSTYRLQLVARALEGEE